MDAEEHARRFALIDAEGVEESRTALHTASQIDAYLRYRPPEPKRRDTMHLDQAVASLESSYAEDDEPFEHGKPMPRLSPEHPPSHRGKVNFIIDPEGWLIVGMTGRQILSGGHAVTAAGHLVFEDPPTITEIHLNFSGHYRPGLDADYCRSTFAALARHPLLSLADPCRILGRKFNDEGSLSRVLSFQRDELVDDSSDLDLFIESFF